MRILGGCCLFLLAVPVLFVLGFFAALGVGMSSVLKDVPVKSVVVATPIPIPAPVRR
jgi:hypothetical protein